MHKSFAINTIGPALIAKHTLGALARNEKSVFAALSKPFQSGVNAQKLFSPDFAVQRLLGVIDTLTPAQTGMLFAWDGTPVPY